MEFIQMYADVDEDGCDLNEDDEQLASNKDDTIFIDESNISVDENFYREFENVDRNLDEPVDDYLDWLH